MHRDATDSSGARRGPTSAADACRAARGSADRPRTADGPGWGWRGPAAVAALAVLALCCLVPGWGPAAGTGPGAVLLRLSLYLSCAAAALLLGTLVSLVCWSPRAQPPDFVSSWSRLAATVRCPLRVSTGLDCLACPRPRARADPGGLRPGGPPAAEARGRLGCAGLVTRAVLGAVVNSSTILCTERSIQAGLRC
jgi:hypothetical protein